MNLAEIEQRIREADLKALDDYKKGAADAPTIYKSEGYANDVKGVGMVFVASEESEDRHGDVIAADGWDFKHYKKNPVLMFSHDYSIAPLGTMGKVWKEDKQILAMPKWDDEDEFAKFIKGKYERGVMRAVSVGFRPLEYEESKDGKGVRFLKQELLEISAVAIPAHPAALQKALNGRKFSIIVPEFFEVFKQPEPMKAPRTAEKPGVSDLSLMHEAVLQLNSEMKGAK